MANACAGANSHARCMCMVCVEVVCVWGARVRGVAVCRRVFCAGCANTKMCTCARSAKHVPMLAPAAPNLEHTEPTHV